MLTGSHIWQISFTSKGRKQLHTLSILIMHSQVDIVAITRAHENGGDKPVKKRHMITSSSVDGRLITTIKAAATAMDSSELSDSESDDESTSLSSIDEDTLNNIPSPWLKRDTPDSPSVYGDCKFISVCFFCLFF